MIFLSSFQQTFIYELILIAVIIALFSSPGNSLSRNFFHSLRICLLRPLYVIFKFSGGRGGGLRFHKTKPSSAFILTDVTYFILFRKTTKLRVQLWSHYCLLIGINKFFKREVIGFKIRFGHSKKETEPT